MFYEKFCSSVFELPFRKNRLVSIICLIVFCFSTFAFAEIGDVQQTGFKSTKKQLKQVRKLIRKGELNKAETVLLRLLQRNPQLDAAKLNLARIFLKQNRLDEAYNLSYDVALKNPNNSWAFALLGNALLGTGNFKDAEISFRNALLLNKKEAFAWAGFGMLDFYENRLQESIRKLKNAEYYRRNDPDIVFSLAKILARAEKYIEASEKYKLFLTISHSHDKDRRDRIKGLIRFLDFLGKRSSLYSVGGEKSTTVPISLVGNRPIIEVRLNRKDKPLKFVLDTGSGMSVISERTARKMKIKSVARGGTARAIGGTGKFGIVYGFIKTFQIGDVKVRNVPVYIRKFHSPSRLVDGYIGISLLSKFITTIDYGELKFSLDREEKKELPMAEEIPLPLRLTTSGFLSGLVKLEGVENSLNFIVDTGASVSVISDDIADLNEIKQFENEERIRVIGAAGITEGVPAFTLPKVSFGDYSSNSLMAVALNLDVINETTGFEQAGILGGNFLKNYRVTFDFSRSNILFEPILKKD